MNSIWSEHVAFGTRNSLQEPLDVEVAVIGAGMAGILTAYLLQERGKEVVVLEADRIASGQTKNTTAKITAQHGLIYQRLLKSVGKEKARQYAQANAHAVDMYRDLICTQNIDCDFEQRDAYLYAYTDTRPLQAELHAAKELGLETAFVTRTELPFPVSGAVVLAGQAQFHPLKFLKAIAAQLAVFEDTTVIRVEDGVVQTARAQVRAKNVVFACHYPFINRPGYFFARMHQERSYVIALEHAIQLNGMYLCVQGGDYSFRNYGELLLLGGGGHRTGDNAAGGKYAVLRSQAEQWFPGCKEVARWSAQDCITADGMPYIGRYSQNRPNWYVATGFGKWGMTSSMVAAERLAALICAEPCAQTSVFTPDRFAARDIPPVCKEGAQAVKGLGKQMFHMPGETWAQLQVGQGGVVECAGEKVGVYRESETRLYTVHTRCPHLGCQLEWNPDEKSWDCPCHGSRFDYTGKLISGPAQEDIAIESLF